MCVHFVWSWGARNVRCYPMNVIAIRAQLLVVTLAIDMRYGSSAPTSSVHISKCGCVLVRWLLLTVRLWWMCGSCHVILELGSDSRCPCLYSPSVGVLIRWLSIWCYMWYENSALTLRVHACILPSVGVLMKWLGICDTWNSFHCHVIRELGSGSQHPCLSGSPSVGVPCEVTPVDGAYVIQDVPLCPCVAVLAGWPLLAGRARLYMPWVYPLSVCPYLGVKADQLAWELVCPWLTLHLKCPLNNAYVWADG